MQCKAEEGGKGGRKADSLPRFATQSEWRTLGQASAVQGRINRSAMPTDDNTAMHMFTRYGELGFRLGADITRMMNLNA